MQSSVSAFGMQIFSRTSILHLHHAMLRFPVNFCHSLETVSLRGSFLRGVFVRVFRCGNWYLKVRSWLEPEDDVFSSKSMWVLTTCILMFFVDIIIYVKMHRTALKEDTPLLAISFLRAFIRQKALLGTIWLISTNVIKHNFWLQFANSEVNLNSNVLDSTPSQHFWFFFHLRTESKS